MADTQPARPKLSPRRVLGWAALSAAVAIAITIFVSNAGLFGLVAPRCQPQPLAAQVVDAAATGQLASLNGTGTGRNYSDLAFEDTSGKPMSIKDLAGKSLLVNFWASWCIPCRAEMPALDALAAEANGPDFAVVTINTGDPQAGKAEAFFTQGAWTNLPFYIDRKFAVLDRLKVSAVSAGLPTTLLLDKKGCEIGVLQGPAEWNSPDGLRVIDALKSI